MKLSICNYVAVEYKTILVTEQLRACLSRYAQSD